MPQVEFDAAGGMIVASGAIIYKQEYKAAMSNFAGVRIVR